MTALTQWNPLKSLTRLDPLTAFDDLFRALPVRPLLREIETIAPDARIEVSEDDRHYRIKAEIPGVEKNDIEISVNGNQIAISAEVKREVKKKEGEKDLYTERYYGKVYRSFTLPLEVDNAKADAHYENGLLTLTLPKKQNGNARRIAVN